MRGGLVTAFVWIGALKFTGYEVANAEPLVTASPLTSRLREAGRTEARETQRGERR